MLHRATITIPDLLAKRRHLIGRGHPLARVLAKVSRGAVSESSRHSSLFRNLVGR